MQAFIVVIGIGNVPIGIAVDKSETLKPKSVRIGTSVIVGVLGGLFLYVTSRTKVLQNRLTVYHPHHPHVVKLSGGGFGAADIQLVVGPLVHI